MYEIILCVVLLLFALDIRFNLFTRWKPVILRAIGWLLRTVIVLLSAVTLFFCGKVITGSMIHTPVRRRIMPLCSDWRWKTGNPHLTCCPDWTQPRIIWKCILKHA